MPWTAWDAVDRLGCRGPLGIFPWGGVAFPVASVLSWRCHFAAAASREVSHGGVRYFWCGARGSDALPRAVTIGSQACCLLNWRRGPPRIAGSLKLVSRLELPVARLAPGAVTPFREPGENVGARVSCCRFGAGPDRMPGTCIRFNGALMLVSAGRSRTRRPFSYPQAILLSGDPSSTIRNFQPVATRRP